MKRVWASVAVMVVALVVGATGVRTQGQSAVKTTLYLIATAHLDTQWNWTVQDSIRDYIPKTFHTNFEFFDKYPDYKFSWEGAIHYMWFKEYHPDEWARVQKYVADDRWRLAGSWIDAVDPNMPSPESLFRQALYAQRFFRQEFKKEPHDVYLPDCFGFGFALPTIAVASGLNSFSTQKLSWGHAIPFPIGRWKGVDGSEVIVALNPGGYGTSLRDEITPAFTNAAGTSTTPWLNDPTPVGGGKQFEFRYFGTGDTGGSPSEASVINLEKSLKDPAQQLDIKNTSPDQMAKDLSAEQRATLPVYNSELLLKTHGTGCYTSQAAMKRFNRVNELLGDEAERAGVAAEFLTGLAYPTERLRDAWIRFIWHQFHDDLTGTCIPQAYQFSWNDEIASMNQFAGVLTSSTSAVSSLLDTSGTGTPLVVYNPLSLDRREPVEATVYFAGPAPLAVRVVDPANGREAPAQVLGTTGVGTRIAFLADAPPVGYRVYNVSPAAAPAGLSSSLKVTPNSLENNRLSVKIDQNGDISSIYDKDAKHELLKAPIMLELRDNTSTSWPAWEVLYETVQSPAREYVSTPTVKVIENGPVRVGVEITRKASGSTFVQRVRLDEGGDRVDVENLVDWRSPNSELKASFPFTASNPKAVYDLGVGTIERANNQPEEYEVVAQKWADIVDASGTYGTGVINDSKYGWDKPNDSTLRLTLLHTPKPGGSYTYQSSNDLGQHRFVYSIAGHAGDWRQGRMPTRAWQVNQPLVAFQTTAHAGVVGRAFSMASITTAPPSGMELPVRDTAGQVSIVALKKAEDSDEYIVRLQERYGLPAVTTLRFAGQIVSAREVNAAEEEIAPIPLSSGRGRGGNAPAVQTSPTMAVTLKPYQPKTIAVKLQTPWEATAAFQAAQAAAAAAAATAAANPAGRGGGGGGRGNATPPLAIPAPKPTAAAMVDLPFNLDGMSGDANRKDGDFDGKGHTLAAELLPSELKLDGLPFKFGSGAPGAMNVLVPKGQTITLPAGSFNRVYVIAAAVGGDVATSITVGGVPKAMTVREWQGPVGQWSSRLKEIGPALKEPFVPARGSNPSQQEIQAGLVVSWDSRTGLVSGIDQIRGAFVKRDEIAWMGGHRHDAKENQVYVASYLFEYALDVPAGTRQITLPNNDKIRIMAITAASEAFHLSPAGALYMGDITAQEPKIPPAAPAPPAKGSGGREGARRATRSEGQRAQGKGRSKLRRAEGRRRDEGAKVRPSPLSPLTFLCPCPFDLPVPSALCPLPFSPTS